MKNLLTSLSLASATILLGVGIAFAAVPLDIKKERTQRIQAEGTFIGMPVVNLNRSFTLVEKVVVKNGLSLTDKESAVVDKVLDRERLSYFRDRAAFRTALQKMADEFPLSTDEKLFLAGFSGETISTQDRMVYLAGKKLEL